MLDWLVPRSLKQRPSAAPRRPVWRLSPYPAGKSFGFTIIHDADSGYSQRLAPIIDAIEALGFRITVTVFPFWADWSPDPEALWAKWRGTDPYFSPVAVPLVDDEERRFYLALRDRGHEIALHTPSETSSKREDVVRAFAYFEEVFGAPARMYVEHSPGNNLDAQSRSGADAQSAYYNTDLLNASGCWIWVCDEETDFPRQRRRGLDVLSDTDGPFSPRAREKYGIERGFIRSRLLPSDGDGFVAAFTDDAIAALERDGGTALVYAHLAAGWLDPETRRLRDDIEKVLRKVAAKEPWAVTGSDMLDRFAALRQVAVTIGDSAIEIGNAGDSGLTEVAIHCPPGYGLMHGDGRLPQASPDTLLLGDLAGRSSLRFEIVRQ